MKCDKVFFPEIFLIGSLLLLLHAYDVASQISASEEKLSDLIEQSLVNVDKIDQLENFNTKRPERSNLRSNNMKRLATINPVSYMMNNKTGLFFSIIHPTPSEAGQNPVPTLRNISSILDSIEDPIIQEILSKAQMPISKKRSNDSLQFNDNPSGDDFHKLDKSLTMSTLKKVRISKRPIEEKEVEYKYGNNLRRQLNLGRGNEFVFIPTRPPQERDVRPTFVLRETPEATDRHAVEPKPAPQDLEVSNGSRKLAPVLTQANFISPQYLRPVVTSDESRYSYVPPTLPPHASGSQLPSVLPHYYHPLYNHQPSVVPTTFRDELMSIIYNYLQMRLSPLLQRLLVAPVNPYVYVNPNYSPLAYTNPYLLLPQYYPSANPHNYPAIPHTTYSSQIAHRAPSAPASIIPEDELLTSQTQISTDSSTTEVTRLKPRKAIRNLQIISESGKGENSGT